MSFDSLLDTPRIYTAIAEWGACVVYIMMLRKKRRDFKLYFALAAMLVWFILYQTVAGMLPLYLWIPGMIGAIGSIYFFIYYICGIPKLDAGFCCFRAFVLAEFVASLHWQIYVWSAIGLNKTSQFASILLLLLVYAVLFVSYFLLEREHLSKSEYLHVDGKELFSSALIALSVFAISNATFVLSDTPLASALSSILYIRTLVDFAGLVLLFDQQDKREKLRMRSENQTMNIMLSRQYDQYRASLDNIELLRREFHDLKHYMVAIRSEKDPEKQQRYLTEMEQAILAQNAMTNTGNHVLDVMLTTKNSYCTRNHITFTCVADGKLLSFIHVKDICSIFGNALDNAIECVTQYASPEKRLISLTMMRRNQFLLIQFENYSEEPLTLTQDRLPRTTKSNQQFHGYGLKSIQVAIEKYGGSMTLQAQEHWFTLQILIPIKEDVSAG
ncbi:MAG: GHKL domain-containing protein [Lachnospiraceae bacterium]